MLVKFKKLLFAPVVTVALFTAAVGIQPASFFLWYQPEEPRQVMWDASRSMCFSRA